MMPTPSEIPGLSLLERMQAENKKLRDENADLKKSIDKLQFFNKILEREITDLKAPKSQDPNGQDDVQTRSTPRLIRSIPVMRVAFYAVILFLSIATTYAIASLFGRKKTNIDPLPATSEKVIQPSAPDKNLAGVTSFSSIKKTFATPKDSIKKPAVKTGDGFLFDPANPDDISLGHYTVRSRAYFHNKPNPATRRELYINHLNHTVLDALDDKNGFVFVIFTNESGRTSSGWLRKIDLEPVNVTHQ